MEKLDEAASHIDKVVAREALMDSNWMAQGLCAEKPPSLFFPSDGVGVDVARKICAECPVKVTCLEYALDNRIDHGVWGGTSERERRRLIKARHGVQPVAVTVGR
jgi:WhiB family redox-sensing transcriptional regulator